MIALVRGERTRSIDAAVRLPLSRSTSANTGVAPCSTTQLVDAMKERGVTTTSSPGPIRHDTQRQLQRDAAIHQGD